MRKILFSLLLSLAFLSAVAVPIVISAAPPPQDVMGHCHAGSTEDDGWECYVYGYEPDQSGYVVMNAHAYRVSNPAYYATASITSYCDVPTYAEAWGSWEGYGGRYIAKVLLKRGSDGAVLASNERWTTNTGQEGGPGPSINVNELLNSGCIYPEFD